jgi:hypothetical protein
MINYMKEDNLIEQVVLALKENLFTLILED